LCFISDEPIDSFVWIFETFFFFENNCGAKPPSNIYINKGEESKLTRGLKEAGRGRRQLTSS
jgi:hypothetical protein